MSTEPPAPEQSRLPHGDGETATEHVSTDDLLERTRASEARYRALVEATTLMVWSTDADGRVDDIPFWRELTGQSPDEVRGDGWANAIHPDDVERVMAVWRDATSGRGPYEAQYRLRLRSGSYRWYRARGVPLFGPDGEVREWVGVFNEIDRLKRRDEGMRFLVEASAALTESLDERATLETLAALAVDNIADGAMITLARDDGSFDHVATRSRDGVTGMLAAETERLYPLPSDASSGYPRAIRTGEAELVPEGAFDEHILPGIAADEIHLERLRRLQMYSAMVVPLVARGTTLGAITLVLHGPARRSAFDATDLALATELGRRAALAIDNSRLFAAERAARAESERAAELTRRLQEITASFARTLTVDEVAAATLSHGVDALSAHSGVLYLANDAGDALDLVARRGASNEVVLPSLRLPLTARTPATDAIRAGELVLFEGRGQAIDHYLELSAASRNAEPAEADAWVAIPLIYGGRTLGAVTLGFTSAGPFTVEDRALLDALGRHCSQALDRARLLDAEREARDEAVRANRAKSELLAKVSHETRQPVHATMGWVETMELGLQGELTDAQRDALRRVKQNQQRLLGVLNDLLDMSRIEAGRLELRLDAVAVAAVVDAVESAVAPQMREKRIAYEFCHVRPDVVVRADREQLVGILTNLLGNAAKFTPGRGHVSVSCEVEEHWVRLTVEDSGIGIPPEFQERVFEPFFQMDAGFTRTTVGTGLGLAIAREAARAMGGDVVVSSAVGVGSRFTVSLLRA